MTITIPILDPQEALLALMNTPTPGRDWTLGAILEQYPWYEPDDHIRAIDAINSRRLTNPRWTSLLSNISRFLQSEPATPTDTVNTTHIEIVDAILTALSATRDPQAFSPSDVHQNDDARRAGMTTRHWLNALIAYEREPDLNQHSDGYTVTFWHRPAHRPQDPAISVSHVHTWNDDKPLYITLTAYRADTCHDPRQPGEAIGSAIVLFP